MGAASALGDGTSTVERSGRATREREASNSSTGASGERPRRRRSGMTGRRQQSASQCAEQAGWPQLHSMDGCAASPSQKAPQYRLPSAAGQLQPGWAHCFSCSFGIRVLVMHFPYQEMLSAHPRQVLKFTSSCFPRNKIPPGSGVGNCTANGRRNSLSSKF